MRQNWYQTLSLFSILTLLTACTQGNVHVPEVVYEPIQPRMITKQEYQYKQETVKPGKIFMRRTASTLPEGTKLGQVAVAKNSSEWVNIEDAEVVIHAEKAPLEDILQIVMRQVAAQSGPWDVRFKLTDENKDLLLQPFSLNTETTFGEFVSFVSEYLMNFRGVAMKFHLFKQTRVLVVTDE